MAEIDTLHILAIDIGKFNNVFCWYEVSWKRTEFRTVPTCPAKMRQLGVTVVIEACSPAG